MGFIKRIYDLQHKYPIQNYPAETNLHGISEYELQLMGVQQKHTSNINIITSEQQLMDENGPLQVIGTPKSLTKSSR